MSIFGRGFPIRAITINRLAVQPAAGLLLPSCVDDDIETVYATSIAIPTLSMSAAFVADDDTITAIAISFYNPLSPALAVDSDAFFVPSIVAEIPGHSTQHIRRARGLRPNATGCSSYPMTRTFAAELREIVDLNWRALIRPQLSVLFLLGPETSSPPLNSARRSQTGLKD